jgi:hypothetical protein
MGLGLLTPRVECSGMQKLTYALVEHAWLEDVERDGREASQSLRTVPEGLAGTGMLSVMGEWIPASFVSSRLDECFRMTAVLPAMEWPALRLMGMPPGRVANGNLQGWSRVGPTVKLCAQQVGGVAKVVLQGYAELIGIQEWFTAGVTDKLGVDMRLVGRVYGGVEMSVRATAQAGALQAATWKVEGYALPSSLEAITLRMHAEARDLCARGHCSDGVARLVQHVGWFHVCWLTTRETIRHGQLGLEVPDWRRATVQLAVWVSGSALSLEVGHVDLSDWTRAARKLATQVLAHAGGKGPHSGGAPKCVGSPVDTGSLAPWPSVSVSDKCETLPAMELPSPQELLAALGRDNAVIAMREEEVADWPEVRSKLARRRYRAAMEAFNRRRAAWESDQAVSRGKSLDQTVRQHYTPVPPTFLADPPGAPTDSYTQYPGMTSPLGGRRVAARLHKITDRLERLQRKLEHKASRVIARKISEERARLLRRWPLSGAQQAALVRAKEHHALAGKSEARASFLFHSFLTCPCNNIVLVVARLQAEVRC